MKSKVAGGASPNLLAALATMIVAFKWEGGLLILGGLPFFAIVNHGVQINLVFGPMFVVGLINLGAGGEVQKSTGFSAVPQ